MSNCKECQEWAADGCDRMCDACEARALEKDPTHCPRCQGEPACPSEFVETSMHTIRCDHPIHTDVQKFPSQSDRRIETGPLQVGDDWPGIFIRGDNAIWWASQLEDAASAVANSPCTGHSVGVYASLKEMASLFRSCAVRDGKDPENLRKISR